MADGATIHVRRHGNPDRPRIILAHGNGFATDAYFPFWERLLRDFDVIVYDQRNHGHNPFHPANHTEAQMADDMDLVLRAVEKNFGKRPTAGAFHSLSSIVSLLHASKYGFSWSALILFDPPLAPPRGHRLHELARSFELSLYEWARRRQRTFASTDELARYFKSTRRLQRWVAGAAELMARAITKPCQGGVELVCPPAFEADIYKQNSESEAWSFASHFASQIFVVSSDFHSNDVDPPGLVSEALNKDFGVQVARVPESGHLLQIERPVEVEAVVRDYLQSHSFG
jgi:pimeloyl-ACP methyl ester carboxylesterase